MHRSIGLMAVPLIVALTSGAGNPARAQGQTPGQDSCEQLWVERNSIYKERGYCFKTARAIRYFGNSGCRYDVERDVPLSRGEQVRIADIQREERALGCR